MDEAPGNGRLVVAACVDVANPWTACEPLPESPGACSLFSRVWEGRVMTRWNCGRCGYLALSSPYEDFKPEDKTEGTETHRCPRCGEQWWLDEDTYARLPRVSGRNE